MFSENGKKPGGPVVVIRRADPLACGGTDETLDTSAPRTIRSEEMTLFSVTSALSWGMAGDVPTADGEPMRYLSAYAAPCGEGTFLFLERGRDPRGRDGERRAWALVREDPFPGLVRLVRQYELAADNGRHSVTHGLPMNFGGSIRIRYADGEAVDVADNQTPVLSVRAAEAVAEVFLRALEGPKLTLPGLDGLREIRFDEEQEDGGFTSAVLTLLPDGTGRNAKRARYSDEPRVYESESAVDAETVAAMRRTIENTGLLAWAGLPDGGFILPGVKKRLRFRFDDGREVTVPEGKQTPEQLRGGFFALELELATKH